MGSHITIFFFSVAAPLVAPERDDGLEHKHSSGTGRGKPKTGFQDSFKERSHVQICSNQMGTFHCSVLFRKESLKVSVDLRMLWSGASKPTPHTQTTRRNRANPCQPELFKRRRLQCPMGEAISFGGVAWGASNSGFASSVTRSSTCHSAPCHVDVDTLETS